MIDDAAWRAEAKLTALAAAGIDLDAVTARLLVEGLAAFQKDFDRLLSRVGDQLECARVTAPGTATLGTLAVGHTLRLDALDRDNAVARIWAKDHTVWKPDPTEITDRLGWLHVAEAMLAEVEGLRAFAAEAAADGFTDAVVLVWALQPAPGSSAKRLGSRPPGPARARLHRPPDHRARRAARPLAHSLRRLQQVWRHDRNPVAV
jgi:hypothetical protein